MATDPGRVGGGGGGIGVVRHGVKEVRKGGEIDREIERKVKTSGGNGGKMKGEGKKKRRKSPLTQHLAVQSLIGLCVKRKVAEGRKGRKERGGKTERKGKRCERNPDGSFASDFFFCFFWIDEGHFTLFPGQGSGSRRCFAFPGCPCARSRLPWQTVDHPLREKIQMIPKGSISASLFFFF